MTFKDRLLAWMIYAFYRTYYMTLRVDVENPWWQNERLDRKRPLILAHWHEDDVALIGRYAFSGFRVIVSRSRDGNLLAYVLQKLGCKPVRGSSSRGGARALLEMIRLLRKHRDCCAVTIDGPRGPRHVAKAGIVKLAQKSSAQIITVSAAAPRRWVFGKSWSRTYLPLPFTKIRHYIDPTPIDVPEILSEAEEKEILLMVERRLQDNHNALNATFRRRKTGFENSM